MFPFSVVLGVRLVVYVLSPPAADGTLDGATASLATALPNDTTLEVVTVRELPKEVVPLANQSIATMVWSEDGRTVVLRVRKAEEKVALERSLSFDPRDSPRERGRTAGFAVASMMTDDATPPPVPAPAARTLPVATATQAVSAGPAPMRAPPTPLRFALDAALSGSIGLGGDAGGIGGGVGARLKIHGPVWLTAALRLRRFEINEVKASSTFSQLAVGAYLGGLVPANDRFRLGLRLDAVLEWQYLSHFSGDEPVPVGEGRIVPVVGVAGEAGFRVSSTLELWLGLGPQVATGRTDLYLRGDLVATIPLLRGVLDLGFRAYF